MEVASPQKESRNANLDVAPPIPPLNKTGGGPAPAPAPTGLGDMANSSQIMTMQGLAMAKDAFQLIANGIPALSQILSNTIADLEQLVVQSMADTMAGTQPQIAAPPGVAPSMPPPPMGGMQGGQGGPPPGAPPGM